MKQSLYKPKCHTIPNGSIFTIGWNQFSLVLSHSKKFERTQIIYFLLEIEDKKLN